MADHIDGLPIQVLIEWPGVG